MSEEIKFDCRTGDGEPFNQAIVFNEPLTMYEGDEFIMEYDDFKVISVVLKRKNSS